MSKGKRSEPRRTEPWRGAQKNTDFKRKDNRKQDPRFKSPKGPGHSQPDSGYRDPKNDEPKKAESRYSGPRKLNPVYQDPKLAGPPQPDSRYSGNRRLNPVYQDPKLEGTRRSDSRFPGSGKPNSGFRDQKNRGPRRPDSRYPDPNRSGPRKPDSRFPDSKRGEPRFPGKPAPPISEPVAPVPAASPSAELGPNMIAGRNPVFEALRAGTTMIEKVIFLAGVKGESIERIRTLAKKKGVLCTDVGKQKFRELASDAITQGVVAIVGIKEYVDIVDILAIAQKLNEAPCLLILDEIEDPHNLGALIRTAECAGFHGVVIPKHHAATVNQTVAKTSAGASEHLPVAKVVNVAQTIDALKKEGIWIVGTDDAAEQAFTKVDYTTPVAIVIGNEGKGMRQLVKEKCDFLVKIPLFGKIGSLNASVAGALVMFEMVKQRKGL